MDTDSVKKRFDELESEGRTLLHNFGNKGLADKPHLSLAWTLSATNLLSLSFPDDGTFTPAFHSATAFASKLEALASAGHEFSLGMVASELRLSFLMIAYTDLTNQAQDLVDGGFSRCAATVARVVLERHLRELARIRSLPDADTKKATLLNQDLWKAHAYNKGTWTEVESLLAVGNEAAHLLDFETKYDLTQVQKMVSGVSSFTKKFS